MRNPRCDRDHYFSCWREGVIACPLVGIIIITIAISTAVVNIILTIEDSISIVIVTVVAHV
jgi:hypothetical protein